MAATVTTPYTYCNWLYTNGALNFAFALSWGAVSIDGRVAQFTGAYDWPRVYRTLPIADAPAAAGHRAPHFRDWVAHPTRDAHWNALSHEDKYDTVAVPILTVEGWYDIFLRGALQDHIAVRATAKSDVARQGKRLLIGPWVHSTGRRNNTPAGQAADPNAVDFGAAAEVDLQRVYLRWFDYWLKGINNGVPDDPPVRIFVMGENDWRDEQEWPLARTQYTNYYLASSGRANSLLGDGRLGYPEYPRIPALTISGDDFLVLNRTTDMALHALALDSARGALTLTVESLLSEGAIGNPGADGAGGGTRGRWFDPRLTLYDTIRYGSLWGLVGIAAAWVMATAWLWYGRWPRLRRGVVGRLHRGDTT